MHRQFLALMTACAMLAIPSLMVAQQGEKPLETKVLTFNIRYDNPRDGENVWLKRRDAVAEVIKENRADVAGLQEALANQITDLQERLPDYAWYGVGRDDGKDKGEFSPLFYRKERFEVLDKGTFWLSETPEKPGSKSWDAALPRIASWLVLKDKASGKSLLVCNTHFDHLGKVAREKSAGVLLRELPKLAGKRPLVLTGDFNCATSDAPYKAFTAAGSDTLRFDDAHRVSAAAHVGPDSTWNGFNKIEPGRRIDFIFVGPGVKCRSHAIIDKRIDGRFASDHLAVLAELTVE